MPPMLFYLQVLIFFASNVLALPVLSENAPREVTTSTTFTPRSEWNIISSCLATLIACSWVAIHPNIPAPSDNLLQILARRLLTMFYMLLAPEVVIIWAGRQWSAAREIAHRNKERGWTRTHGFFVLMGGFMLYENGTISRTLAPEELERLFAEGRIEWPTISQKEIEDKSKGDIFSKGFALLQSTWFVTQCMVRGAYGLPLTHLELVTVAFAGLNAVVYFLWWNKPMDVGCSVPVHLLPPPTDVTGETGTQTVDQSHSVADTNNGSQPSSLEPPTPDPAKLYAPQSVTQPEKESNLPILDPHTPIQQASCPSARVLSYIWRKVLSMGPFAILYILIWKPLEYIWSDLRDMLVVCDTVDNRHGTQSVPAFYAPPSSGLGIPMMIGLSMGTLFGGIHCAAWSFPFPSINEQLLWRISAVFITATPFLTPFYGYIHLSIIALSKVHEGPWDTVIHTALGVFTSLILLAYIVARLINNLAYAVARVMLLVLPFLALTSLSSGALLAVYWSISIPHI